MAILLAACTLLAACGQRGPLYLPDQAPKKRVAPAAMRSETPKLASGHVPAPGAIAIPVARYAAYF
ncbi:MAG: lipoprotein [Burkholderiaceae bacterium]|nr:lipoprotein [Burkholderiaceae bacterium]